MYYNLYCYVFYIYYIIIVTNRDAHTHTHMHACTLSGLLNFIANFSSYIRTGSFVQGWINGQ